MHKFLNVFTFFNYDNNIIICVLGQKFHESLKIFRDPSIEKHILNDIGAIQIIRVTLGGGGQQSVTRTFFDF